MQFEPSTQPEHATRPVPTAWWPFVRIALIGWAAIGVFRFVLILAFDSRGRGLLLIPDIVDFFGCACLLLGAIAAFALDGRNTALTVGAASLGLHLVLFTWFRGSLSESYFQVFLIGVQHVWFPIALVTLKIITPRDPMAGDAPGPAPLDQMGSPKPLLLAAQIPGVAGMLLLAAMFTGMIRLDPFGATVMIVLTLTVGASVLSAALSLVFVRTPLSVLARRLAITHMVYLGGLIVTCAVIIVIGKSR